ncbi:hypothetical protein BC831DRAFT_473058 [Entophlyctis helioformis]|nr:hypothetical protein BC831DRAFT_473058 [Entophlyctis helioformis]
MSKTATVFVLDVRSWMRAERVRAEGDADGLLHDAALDEEGPLEPTFSEHARKLVALKLQELIIAGRKGDHVAIVLVGTQGTSYWNGGTADGGGSLDFENLTVHDYDPDQPLMRMPNIGSLRCVLDDTQQVCTRGDILEGILLGIFLLKAHCQKLKFTKKILVLTSAGGSLTADFVDPIIGRARELALDFQMIGYGFPEPGDTTDPDKTANAETLRALTRSIPWPGRASDDDINEVASPREAMESIDRLKRKQVNPAVLFKGDLTYGLNDMQIPIRVYSKTMEAKVPSAKKYSGVADSVPVSERPAYGFGDVTVKTTYKFVHTDDVEAAAAASSSTGGDARAGAPERREHPDAQEIGEETEEHENGGVPNADDNKPINAFRYGKALVPFAAEDEKAAKVETAKSMKIIRFVKASTIPRHYYMANTLVVMPDTAFGHAAKMFSTFIESLFENQAVAIIRYCRIANAAPKIGALVPHKKGYGLYTTLPFANDIRVLSFPSFEYLTADMPVAGHGGRDGGRDGGRESERAGADGAQRLAASMSMAPSTTTRSASGMPLSGSAAPASSGFAVPSNRVSQGVAGTQGSTDTDETGAERRVKHKLHTRTVAAADALDAIDALIDTMDISAAHLTHSFNPKQVFNPVQQYLYECVVHRAVHPESTELPPRAPRVVRLVNPDPEVVAQAATAAEKLKQAFGVEKVVVDDSKTAKGIWADRAARAAAALADGRGVDADGHAATQATGGGADEPAATLMGLTQRVVTEISAVDPVSDFRQMLSRRPDDPDTDMVDLAMQQMAAMITQLIAESLGSAFYPKALDALRSLREECVRHTESGRFNAVLVRLKTELLAGGSAGGVMERHKAFWDVVVDAGVTLVSVDESHDSTVTAQEAVDVSACTGVAW